MMVQRFDPGCCCENVACDIFADNFDRADGPVGADWTTVSGTWAIDTNRLKCTASGLLLCNTVHPDSEVKQWAAFTCTPITNQDKARVILDYVDSNNYHYVELEMGTTAPAIRFYVVTAGAPFQIGSDVTVAAPLGASYSLVGCHDGVRIAARFNGTWYCQVSTAHGGYKTGVGASVAGAQFTFDNFDYNKLQSSTEPTCPGMGCPGDCSVCTGGTAPANIQVVLSGITNAGLGGCTDCSNLDGTYLLTYAGEVSSGVCHWILGINIDTNCTGGPINWNIIEAFTAPGGLFTVRIRYSGATGVSFIDTSPDYDCLNWSSYSVPYSGSSGYCIGSSATCLVTAL